MEASAYGLDHPAAVMAVRRPMALTFRNGSPWWLLEGVEADDRAGQHRQR
jgi:hypothetical protein